MEKFLFDVMLDERYQCTLAFPLGLEHARLDLGGGKIRYEVTLEELREYVLVRRPTLRGKPYRIYPTNSCPKQTRQKDITLHRPWEAWNDKSRWQSGKTLGASDRRSFF